MIESKLIRCAPDAPNRCQSSGWEGQCPYMAEEGSTLCPRHRAITAKAEEKQKVRMYRLARYQARVSDFADNDQLKGLREEIGILRMVLENIVNSCKDESELIIYSGRISDTIMKIEKVVSSCQRLEITTSQMLDKTKVVQLANMIIAVITNHVTDVNIIDAITNDIAAVLEPSTLMNGESLRNHENASDSRFQ